ncbi:MAG: acyl-CoA dehydrogenase [Candidatus Melainabacteria bacterium]|nr:acyl-CoA dehydrogenase [Candidatus Melainabacteria bacterium]
MTLKNDKGSRGNKPADNLITGNSGKGRRGDFFFRFILNTMKKMKVLPQISETERQALEAGDVWLDGDIFAGKPNFRSMLSKPYGGLTAEEQAFLDGPLVELCRMFDHYEVGQTRRVPKHVDDFIKSQGFMGLIIPKQYGGRGFSRLAVSTILHTITPYSFTVGVRVMIPNSLGAGELLIHYGTDAQKKFYLPKLASGEFVPCFGLTETQAGSDAASMKSGGVVFRDTDGEVKIRLNFEKRYITLAPISNLCTVAIQLSDPDNLLNKTTAENKGDIGITCVLIHAGTPGFENGPHHIPIGEPFENGTLKGVDVIVPVDSIIGGAEYAGGGWKMLMEQLAGGRCVSLPAGAVGNLKMGAAAVGAYSMVRSQFNRQIGQMEGIEEKVASIAGMTYMLDAARIFVCSAVDEGVQPPVTSAVLKAYTTEIARKAGIDAMDVFAGAAVMQGPRNILSKGYTGAPVGITVEGANILTRTLMIFGQGATRCHPYALKVVHAVDNNDVPAFRWNLCGWMLHFGLGLVRTGVRSLTRGWTTSVPNVAPETRTYYRRLGWAGAHFGTLTDLAMFTVGGKLKARQMLTGRYADAVGWMLLGFSALRRFEAEGRRKEDLPLVRYALAQALSEVQTAFEGIYANFDVPVLGFLMRTVGAYTLRLNPIGRAPSDAVARKAAATVQTYGQQFDRLTEGVFMPDEDAPGLGQLIKAFRLVTETQPTVDAIIKAQRSKQLHRGVINADITAQAVALGVITQPQADRLALAHAAKLKAIEVDVFSHEEYYLDGATK